MRIEKKETNTKHEYIVWNETKTQIIAGATLENSKNPVMLKRIDVQRNRRNDGIGTKLLEKIVTDYKDSKIVAEVFTSRTDWYQRNGFEIEEKNDRLVKVKREPQ